MAKLTFKIADVRKLYEHAQNSKEHRASFSHLIDPKLLKAGETMPKVGYATSAQLDLSKIPAHLLLVKDQGCYLMSSGLPSLLGAKGEPNLVVYAKGLGQDCDYDKLRAACGGDDFSEALPAEWFDAPMKTGATELHINLTKTKLSISYR